MHALQKRVEAMEKVGAGALADQALRKLVRLHLQKYEKQHPATTGLEALHHILAEIETLESTTGSSGKA